MSWATPRTWVVGEMVNAALMNQYARDNLTYLRNQVACKITRTGANVALTSGSSTAVDFDTTEFDTSPGAAMADLTNNRINFVDSGKYLIGGVAQTSSPNGVGRREMRIFYHDSVANTNMRIVHDGDEGYVASVSTMYAEKLYDAKAGDYIYMEVFHNATVNLNQNTVAGLCPQLYAVREGI